ERLRDAGERAIVLPRHDEPAAALDEIRAAHGPIEGILHLAPLETVTTLADETLESWQTRINREIRALDLLIRCAGRDLEDAGRGRAVVMAATSMGGAFAWGAPPPTAVTHEGVAAFVRTAALELRGVRCLTVDLDPAAPASVQSARLFDELLASGEETEVGYV